MSENEAYTLSLTIEPRDSIQAIEQMLREEQKLRERLQNLEMRCAHLEDCNQKNKLLLKLFSERTVAHKYLPRSPGRKSSVPVFCNGSLSRNKSYRSMDFNATEEATTAEQSQQQDRGNSKFPSRPAPIPPRKAMVDAGLSESYIESVTLSKNDETAIPSFKYNEKGDVMMIESAKGLQGSTEALGGISPPELNSFKYHQPTEASYRRRNLLNLLDPYDS